MIEFRTHPTRYRHWSLTVDGRIATLSLNVDEQGGLSGDYELKLNSYDLGVDIELYDAVQRIRFEHPEVGAIVLTSSRDKVFSSGANIRMLGSLPHAAKVNFCKFTNETRLAIEEASARSGQKYLAAINGTAAGGGYELALAADHIILVDDRSSAVSLPEVPLLGVLPGTGGLTRLVDKRKVRRDRADVFCLLEEGIRGQRAREWGLVDEIVPATSFDDAVRERAAALAGLSDRPTGAAGVTFGELDRRVDGRTIRYPHLRVEIDDAQRTATLTVEGPEAGEPGTPDTIDDSFWALALARALDDAILHLRTNEPEVTTFVFRSEGDIECVEAFDRFLYDNRDHWLVREIALYWGRILKRIDVTSRSLIALVEPGSCFAGLLLELVLATDRSYMLDGVFEGDNRGPASVRLSRANVGFLPMGNGLSRLATRHLGSPKLLDEAHTFIGESLDAEAAERLGIATFTPDDIDWEDDVRLAVEERASFSSDALTGMEANLRFAGPETMETKIFARLSAWQNWIFQRPNAAGDESALKLYGSGRRAKFDKERV